MFHPYTTPWSLPIVTTIIICISKVQEKDQLALLINIKIYAKRAIFFYRPRVCYRKVTGRHVPIYTSQYLLFIKMNV